VKEFGVRHQSPFALAGISAKAVPAAKFDVVLNSIPSTVTLPVNEKLEACAAVIVEPVPDDMD
jgi:hypothetical protein